MEKQKTKKNIKLRDKLAKYSQYFINVIFIIITLVTAVYLCSELYKFTVEILFSEIKNKKFIEEIFYLLIIIEVMFIGIKYFSENLHIPKRYFLYIGITTLVKEIFINPENALLYTGAILLLVIASSVIKLVNLLTNEKQDLPPGES